jgi:hypothetical protein
MHAVQQMSRIEVCGSRNVDQRNASSPILKNEMLDRRSFNQKDAKLFNSTQTQEDQSKPFFFFFFLGIIFQVHLSKFQKNL